MAFFVYGVAGWTGRNHIMDAKVHQSIELMSVPVKLDGEEAGVYPYLVTTMLPLSTSRRSMMRDRQ